MNISLWCVYYRSQPKSTTSAPVGGSAAVGANLKELKAAREEIETLKEQVGNESH